MALLHGDSSVAAVNIPVAQPDPDLIEELIGKIADQEARIREAEIEAASAGGLQVAATCGETLISLAAQDYRNLQVLLIEGGYLRGQADGVWGPASRAAMMAFQKEQGLPETGVPNSATMATMGLR